MKKFFENDLFILDLANNHFGDVEHAIGVVRSMAKVIQDHEVNAAIKLQLRNLDTFVHSSMKDSQHRYVRRFLDTSLTLENFRRITDVIRESGLRVMATPFDESSVENFDLLGIEILKVASASANDLPLLSAVSQTKYPIVASTGGLSQFEIDELYSKLLGSGNEFALMHCVSIYPSPPETLQMLQIRNFKNRYSGTPIGWSTHEDPDDTYPIVIAKTLGASLFERHVGVKSEKYALNNYSSAPSQLEKWLNAYHRANEMLGSELRLPSSEAEQESIRQLRRGFFVASDRVAGSEIGNSIQAAFPVVDDEQLTTADDLGQGVAYAQDVVSGVPLLRSMLSSRSNELDEDYQLRKIIYEVRALLARAGVNLNREAQLELSHHYGLDRFREFGASLFTVLNREYAKKLVVMLPRQKHPTHKHLKKEETFQLLWGDLDLNIDGQRHIMKPGQILTVERGSWHKFQTNYGAVVEEISTHAHVADSVYSDEIIQKNPNRKTSVTFWSNWIPAV
jgi:sialic acid synthase SpsE/quercetin dioxygenase-like cupin family protein